MNSRRYIWCVIVAIDSIYSVRRLIDVGINPLCDYHQFFIQYISDQALLAKVETRGDL
jgi:hypothetical protein